MKRILAAVEKSSLSSCLYASSYLPRFDSATLLSLTFLLLLFVGLVVLLLLAVVEFGLVWTCFDRFAKRTQAALARNMVLSTFACSFHRRKYKSFQVLRKRPFRFIYFNTLQKFP